MSITNKDRINENNDRINRLIELVKQKALTSNPKYAATEEEMDAMLTDRNVGKVIKYIGAPVGTPPVVGDVVDKLYFNTDITPNFEAIKNDSTVIKGADIHQDFASSYFILVMGTEAGEDAGYLGFTDMSEMQEGLWALMFFGSDGIIYLSQDVPAEITDGDPFPAGWQMDSINIQEAFGEEVSVTQIGGQNLWSSYISKEPFTSGKYEKNALYIIAEGEREVIENPTAIGDEVTQVYFDTTKSAEEVYNLLSNVTFDFTTEGFSVATLFGTAAWKSDANPTGQISYAVADIDENGNKLYYLINEDDSGLFWAYSPTADPSVIEVEAWGWQKTSPFIATEPFTIAYMSNKEIWGSWLSASDQFTTIGEPAAPRARRLNTTEGTLTITQNGTFNVANMETVIVNVAGSGSGGSLVATTEEELNALDTPENVGKTVSYNDGLYIITED